MAANTTPVVAAPWSLSSRVMVGVGAVLTVALLVFLYIPHS